MIGLIARTVGMIHVQEHKDEIIINGISRLVFELDINKKWGTTILSKNMFLNSNRYQLRFKKFFAMDVYYLIETMMKEGRTRTPNRILHKVLEELQEKTWLGTIKNSQPSQVDLSKLKNFSIYEPKSYQLEFIRHYLTIVPAYQLRGYMLDSAPGTGKTMSQLYLGHIVSENAKKVFVVPKNSVKEVWVATIENLLTTKSTVWDSLSGKVLTNDYEYYVVHFDQLEEFARYVDNNQAAFEGAYLGLDESHNFNRMAANRTQTFVELSQLSCFKARIWASGTPIAALGTECIPFLRCIDPWFDEETQKSFSKIYGANGKRANDILRHRIGHLKFFVPSQDAVTIKTNIHDFKVTIPDGNKFTMDAIRGELQQFINERGKHYAANFKHYENLYYEGLEAFKKTQAYRNDPTAFDTYRSRFKVISTGYDPKIHSEIAKAVNIYELKTIIPNLPNSKMGKDFKSARSVLKYVDLKIMGEALGLLSRYRSRCFAEMVPHSKLVELIDGASKKTIIFTSYVETVETTRDYLVKEGFKPITIYGDTNKNLSPLVKQFYADPDANPLIATFQSLSTAVPLIAANRIINLNQPFRDLTKTQAIARAARLGQDSDVDVFDILLDTGMAENISTRNADILEWSQDMVASIMGKQNVDLDTLTMESMDSDMSISNEEKTNDVIEVSNESLSAFFGAAVGVESNEGFKDTIKDTWNFMFGRKKEIVKASAKNNSTSAVIPLTGMEHFDEGDYKNELATMSKLEDGKHYKIHLSAKASALLTRGGKAIEDSHLVAEIEKDYKQQASMTSAYRGIFEGWMDKAIKNEALTESGWKALASKHPEVDHKNFSALSDEDKAAAIKWANDSLKGGQKVPVVCDAFKEPHYDWLGIGKIEFKVGRAFNVYGKDFSLPKVEARDVILSGKDIKHIAKLFAKWPGMLVESRRSDKTVAGYTDYPYRAMRGIEADEDLMTNFNLLYEIHESDNMYFEPFRETFAYVASAFAKATEVEVSNEGLITWLKGRKKLEGSGKADSDISYELGKIKPVLDSLSDVKHGKVTVHLTETEVGLLSRDNKLPDSHLINEVKKDWAHAKSLTDKYLPIAKRYIDAIKPLAIEFNKKIEKLDIDEAYELYEEYSNIFRDSAPKSVYESFSEDSYHWLGTGPVKLKRPNYASFSESLNASHKSRGVKPLTIELPVSDILAMVDLITKWPGIEAEVEDLASKVAIPYGFDDAPLRGKLDDNPYELPVCIEDIIVMNAFTLPFNWTASVIINIVKRIDVKGISMESHLDSNLTPPMYLYHGSKFKQAELKPGIMHTGKLVEWDGGLETNEYLYTSTDRDSAALLGIASRIEKDLDVLSTHIDEKKRVLEVICGDVVVNRSDILKSDAYLYIIKTGNNDAGWFKNHNPHNNIDNEWKTESTIPSSAIVACETVEAKEMLKFWEIVIVKGGTK